MGSTFKNENLFNLLKANLSCHINKNLNKELINTLIIQIMDSIDFMVSNKN